jgi:ketosteroid isomerase-like protein
MRTMTALPLTTLLSLVALCLFAAPTPLQSSGNAKAAVEQVLHIQQDAWNRHDLDAFMAGYWNSPDLTFFSGAKETAGWQATLDRYRATYASPGHEMGKLDFSDLRIEMLGPEAAFVRGAWQLTLSDGKTPHGRFTLVFRKFPDGWKIIHDHTSAAERIAFHPLSFEPTSKMKHASAALAKDWFSQAQPPTIWQKLSSFITSLYKRPSPS